MEQGRLFFEGGGGLAVSFPFSNVECSFLYGQVGRLDFSNGALEVVDNGGEIQRGCLFCVGGVLWDGCRLMLEVFFLYLNVFFRYAIIWSKNILSNI